MLTTDCPVRDKRLAPAAEAEYFYLSIISIVRTCFKNRIVRITAFLTNGCQTKNQRNGTNGGCPLCLHDVPPQWILGILTREMRKSF